MLKAVAGVRMIETLRYHKLLRGSVLNFGRVNGLLHSAVSIEKFLMHNGGPMKEKGEKQVIQRMSRLHMGASGHPCRFLIAVLVLE